MLIVGICAGGYKIWVINIKATTKQLATLQEGLSIARVLSPNPSQKRGCEVVSVIPQKEQRTDIFFFKSLIHQTANFLHFSFKMYFNGNFRLLNRISEYSLRLQKGLYEIYY